MMVENLRRELVKSLKTKFGAESMVVRSFPNIDLKFPVISVKFNGYHSLINPTMGMLASRFDESLVFLETVQVNIGTIEPRSGADESRLELQSLTSRVESFMKRNWPSIMSQHGCAVYYRGSFGVNMGDSMYNQRRVNTSTIGVQMQVPRNLLFYEDEDVGKPVDKITFYPSGFEEGITISD